MKAPSVTVTLISSDKYQKQHRIKIVSGNKEIFLVTDPPSGKGTEIARLTVQNMTKDVKDEDGDYHTKPSENFYLCFERSMEHGCSGSKDTAIGLIDENSFLRED